MLTAKEARELAKENYSREVIEQLTKVDEMIFTNAKNGDLYLKFTTEKKLPYQVIVELQKNGYHIDDWQNWENSNYFVYEISWK